MNNKKLCIIAGLFFNLYLAVERLLMYQNNANAVRYILFHKLSPALMAILKDGLKPEVITSFKITFTAGPKLMEEFITNRSIGARGVVLIH